ncbi:MAG: HDOD domain-containing protein [Deltaproteobacteria bacterium]|nr:HDOD domain-containing protein [Deltaproteobacteria bacterium]
MGGETQALRSKIEEVKNIPTLPGVVSKITSMIHDPHVSTEKLGRIISHDQVLSAKVLKLVNSPFYGFPGRISSVSHALVLLGFNVIKGMLISASVFDMMSRAMVGLWEHSLGCATVAGIIGRKLDETDSEEVFIAGLLHDIGKVMIKVTLPEDFEAILRTAREEGLYMREVEERMVGIDHAGIARWVAAKWNLPENIAEPMTCHHEPSRARNYRRRAAMVHLADLLIQAVGFGESGSPFVPPLDSRTFSILGVDLRFVETVLQELEEDMDSLSEFSLEV